jgi:hypothetical protein
VQAETINLREVMFFLFAAGVVVPLVHRLGISPVFGFLVVGLAIGPNGVARFADVATWLHYISITDLEGVAPLTAKRSRSEAGIDAQEWQEGTQRRNGRFLTSLLKPS